MALSGRRREDRKKAMTDTAVYPPWPPDPDELVGVQTGDLRDGDMVVGPSEWQPGMHGAWWRVETVPPGNFRFVSQQGDGSQEFTMGQGVTLQQVHCVRPYAAVRPSPPVSNGTCPQCGAPAYVGFMSVECHGKGCT